MLKQLNYVFSRREKVLLFLLMVVVIIGSFLELIGVALFSPFIEIIMKPEMVTENELLNSLYEFSNAGSTENFLTLLAVIIMFVYVVKNLFLWGEQNFILRFSYNNQRTLSTKLLKTYLTQPYTFHLNKNIAELQRSTQEDTTLFTQLLIHFLQLIAEITVCSVIGIYLFLVSKSIATVTSVLLVVCVGFFTYVTKQFSKSLGKEAQVYKGKIYQWINQSLGGVKEVKVLNREDFFIDSYNKYFKQYIRDVRLNKLLSMTPKYLVETVCMSGLLLAIIIKMNFGKGDLVDFLPQLAVFAVAAFRLLPSVGRINDHVNNILFASPSVELIYHDLKEIEEYEEVIAKEEKHPWKFEKEISVQDVVFSYPKSEVRVLEKASLVIPKGKTVALIGSSGAGKTTLADVILGLLSPTLGNVFVDEMDVYRNLSEWHKHIGYIPQSIYLSDDTIRNNIAFGIVEENIDDSAVQEALKKAQLNTFVNDLPEGVNSFVGDRGVRLSGGQRQRIGIARALYHNPEILVFDEATSALDNDTEKAVMESIDSLHGTKTMILIAHRLTTIKKADIIYEVVDGKAIVKTKKEIFGEEL